MNDPIDPRLKLKVSELTEDQRCEWEERAAIIEYDGGLHRMTAEWEAWKQLFPTLKTTEPQER